MKHPSLHTHQHLSSAVSTNAEPVHNAMDSLSPQQQPALMHSGMPAAKRKETPLKQLQSASIGEGGLHLECDVLNAVTKDVIRCTQTLHSHTAVYRDIKVKKVRKYSSVPPLTPLCVRVKASLDCYIYIVNIGSSGNVTTLVPNDHEPCHLLEPGRTLQFPPEGADYEFELDKQSGVETLVLLAYSTPCGVEQAESDCHRIKENAAICRDITVRQKSQTPLGLLEVQFSHEP